MKFYRIERVSDNIKKEFFPCIPKKLLPVIEDSTTPRVCVSSSINGCLGSVPWGGCNLESFIKDGNQIIRVYEFKEEDIDKNNIVNPDFLYKNDLVRDALVHDEYWIVNQKIKPYRIYNIKIELMNIFWRETFSFQDLMKINKGDICVEDVDVFTSYEVDIKYKIIND